MSGALRKIAGNASKHNCTIVFINQLRQKVCRCGRAHSRAPRRRELWPPRASAGPRHASPGTAPRCRPPGSKQLLTAPSRCRRCCAQVGVIYGNPEVTSGGQALKYYASVR